MCVPGFAGNNNWSSEQASSGNHYNVNLNNGNVNSNNDSNTNNVVCRQGVLTACAAALSGYIRQPYTVRCEAFFYLQYGVNIHLLNVVSWWSAIQFCRQCFFIRTEVYCELPGSMYIFSSPA